jgi:Transposase DDE domain group 1
MSCSSAGSRTCSRVRLAARLTKSGACTPASATKPRAGATHAGSWPRSSGTLANSIHGWASWSRTCAARPSGWWPSTMGGARRSSGFREGKNAAKWTRLSCRSMRANAVRLQLHALAYNLANFFRTLVLPDEVERWSLTTLREKVVKIGAKVIAHARYTVFQMAEVAVPRNLFGRILAMINDLRPRPVARC